MAENSASDSGFDQLVDDYVGLLDWLSAGWEKQANLVRLIAVKCPEFIAVVPFKPGAYIQGLSEIQEKAKKVFRTSLEEVRKKIRSDPDLVAASDSVMEFYEKKDEGRGKILSGGKSISQMIVSVGWGNDKAIDCFLDLEHALAENEDGFAPKEMILACRKQARKFQAYSAGNINQAKQGYEIPKARSSSSVSKPLAQYERDALLSYGEAIKEFPQLESKTLKRVYDWIQSVGVDVNGKRYKLPTYSTWETNLRHARQKTGIIPPDASER